MRKKPIIIVTLRNKNGGLPHREGFTSAKRAREYADRFADNPVWEVASVRTEQPAGR